MKKILFIFFAWIHLISLPSQVTPPKIKQITTVTKQLEPKQEFLSRSVGTFDKNGNELECVSYDDVDRLTSRTTSVYDATGKLSKFIWWWAWFIPHDYGGSEHEF